MRRDRDRLEDAMSNYGKRKEDIGEVVDFHRAFRVGDVVRRSEVVLMEIQGHQRPTLFAYKRSE